MDTARREVLLADGAMGTLLVSRGAAPVLAQRLDYLRDGEYASMAGPNPMHAYDHASISK